MWGVDTVGISFPVHSDFDRSGCQVTVNNAGTPEQTEKYSWKLPSGGFAAAGIGGRCWIEASIPKVVRGHNVEPATAAEVFDGLAQLYAEACERVAPELDAPRSLTHGVPSELRVRRVDVVRDFHGVDRMRPLLDGLAGFPRGRRWTVRRYADAERGDAQTLRIGPRSAWSATLYDKLAEAFGVHDGTQLRYELRARAPFLTSKTAAQYGRCVETLAQFDLDTLCRLASDRFHAVGYDQPVGGGHRLAQIIREADITDRVRRTLVGYLACRSLGIDTGMSSNTERKYRQLAQDLGLSTASLSPDDVIDCTARLDIASGSQVLHVGEHHGHDQVTSSDD